MFAKDATWHEVDSATWRTSVERALEASLALMLAVGVFLVGRRISGALETPLAVLPLACTALFLAAWAILLRVSLGDRRIDWLALAALVLFAVGCSFPGERSADWLVWLGALAAYGLVPLAPALRGVVADRGETAAGLVLQQLTRSRSGDGCETIHGTFVAEFAPHERTAVVHVPFCPPFDMLPSVEVVSPDGDAKVAQVLHQGARVEIRLRQEPSAPRSIAVEIIATAQPLLAV